MRRGRPSFTVCVNGESAVEREVILRIHPEQTYAGESVEVGQAPAECAVHSSRDTFWFTLQISPILRRMQPALKIDEQQTRCREPSPKID